MRGGVSTKTIESLKRAHREQLDLCSDLEAIADSLPAGPDRQTCIELAERVEPVMVHAHELEKSVLFPALSHVELMNFDFRPTVERLKVEHYEDECFAEELRDVLASYGQGEPQHSAEATGYMLRGFFESVRRHVAFSRELLESIARDARGGLRH